MSARKEVYTFMDSWYWYSCTKHTISQCACSCSPSTGGTVPIKFATQPVDNNEKLQSGHEMSQRRISNLNESSKNWSPSIQTLFAYWVREWIKVRHYDNKVIMFGVSYEADAQMVHLERQGIVDGIITDDGPFVYHPPPHTYTCAHVMHACMQWTRGSSAVTMF